MRRGLDHGCELDVSLPSVKEELFDLVLGKRSWGSQEGMPLICELVFKGKPNTIDFVCNRPFDIVFERFEPVLMVL
jgi:hypothetical protein